MELFDLYLAKMGEEDKREHYKHVSREADYVAQKGMFETRICK